MTEVSVRVRWEGAHRLPELPGKCQSLHGHSWQAWITLDGPVSPVSGVVADFSALKTGLQGWVDAYLDHAVMLGAGDDLVDVLAARGMRVFVFENHPGHAAGLRWPTVENVALLLYRVAVAAVTGLGGVEVVRVEVAETENNRAAAP